MKTDRRLSHRTISSMIVVFNLCALSMPVVVPVLDRLEPLVFVWDIEYFFGAPSFLHIFSLLLPLSGAALFVCALIHVFAALKPAPDRVWMGVAFLIHVLGRLFVDVTLILQFNPWGLGYLDPLPLMAMCGGLASLTGLILEGMALFARDRRPKRLWVLCTGLGGALVLSLGLGSVLSIALPEPRTPENIVYAKRARCVRLSWEDHWPRDDLFLVLRLRDLPEGLAQQHDLLSSLEKNSFVMARNRKCPFRFAFSVTHIATSGTEEGHILVATIPQRIRGMTLHLEGSHPVAFRAQRRIELVVTESEMMQ
ncbi:MAG: hypothetical protein A2V98_13015 [Planctomycetes bacterium RBG_16_64_12]|nr:MAG: hypothetical protein A2V98_13015 [Planctomycetes bacterium RBG_16_64_12]